MIDLVMVACFLVGIIWAFAFVFIVYKVLKSEDEYEKSRGIK